MTPPPTMTARARSGRSVVTPYLLQQPGERAGAEAGGGLLEALHPPRREVVLDVTHLRLDHAPQRPAVRRDQRLQTGPGDPVAQPTTVVRHDQLLHLVGVEAALGGEVAELEAGVVVAGVLVVDQPQSDTVVQEVSGQEVVVARHRPLLPDRERLADRLEPVIVGLVAAG